MTHERPITAALALALTATLLATPGLLPDAEAKERKAAAAPVPSEMALYAQQIDFTSTVNQRPYRILVSIPARPAPPEGHPVVYLIDGNLHFGIAVDTARIQSRWPDLRDPVIVGIGYQTASVSEALMLRTIDLTTPVTPAYLSKGWIAEMKSKPEEFGGMDAYLRMVDEEIKPRVEKLAKIDRNNQTLMGHSLGGLTTLHALFRRPGSFQQYVSISPSIWWDDRSVLEHEPAFTSQVKAGGIKARLLISVGGLESANRAYPPGMPYSREGMYAMFDATRMVPNTVELGTRLQRLNSDAFHVETVVHEGDDHNMVPPAGIARGIWFTQRIPVETMGAR